MGRECWLWLRGLLGSIQLAWERAEDNRLHVEYYEPCTEILETKKADKYMLCANDDGRKIADNLFNNSNFNVNMTEQQWDYLGSFNILNK